MPMELFWEMRQQKGIAQAGADASQARSKVERLQTDVKILSRKVERLSLASQALWELLRDNTDFSDETILNKIQEVDLRDGQADGKLGHAPVVCTQCGREGNSVRVECLYCGTAFPRKHVFE